MYYNFCTCYDTVMYVQIRLTGVPVLVAIILIKLLISNRLVYTSIVKCLFR